MGDLPQSMDARICSPGAANAHSLATEAPDGGFDGLLDRRMVVLALPAGITGAVIFDIKAIARPQPITVPSGTALPRMKSRAASGLPPAFCKLKSRTAPSPQAMVS